MFEVLGYLGITFNQFRVSKTSVKRSLNLAGDEEEEDSGETPVSPIWELEVVEVIQQVVWNTLVGIVLLEVRRVDICAQGVDYACKLVCLSV